MDFLKTIYNNRKYLIISVFIISVVFSVVFLLFFKNIGPAGHQEVSSDYRIWYKPVAESILRGEGIRKEGIIRSHFGPGFPIIMAGILGLSYLFGINELILITIMNIILAALSACLIFLIAEHILNRKIALISSFLWLTYPFNLWFVKGPHNETPFIPLFLLGIYLFIILIRKRQLGLAFLSGLAFGLSFLMRYITIFLPFFLALLVFFFLKDISVKKQFLIILAFLIGSIGIVSPWIIYTVSRTGEFIPSFTLGPLAITFSIIYLLDSGVENGAGFPEDVVNLIERIRSSGKELGSNKIKTLQFFGREFIARPVPLLKLIFIKLTRSWYGTSQRWWEGRILLVQLLYLIPSFLGLAYLFKNKKYSKEILFILSIIFYTWVMTFLVVSILRYMVPIMGLMMIFSAIFVNLIIQKIKGRFKNLLRK